MNRVRVAIAIISLLLPLPGLAQKLPPEIAASKVVKGGLNSGYMPLEIKDPQTGAFIGFDIDLAAAMAKVLGVKIEYQDGAFENMTPALQSGRIDMIMSGFYDIPRRRPMFDFIDYLRAGAQFYTLQANADLKTPMDLCGKPVTTGRGSSYPDTIKKWSDANCVAAGKPPIEVITMTDLPQELSGLKQGRVVAGVVGLEAVPTLSESEGGTVYRKLGDPISSTLMGMAFQKDDPTLRDAFHEALKKVIADGQYAALIKKWKLDLSAYDKATINEGPAP